MARAAFRERTRGKPDVDVSEVGALLATVCRPRGLPQITAEPDSGSATTMRAGPAARSPRARDHPRRLTAVLPYLAYSR